MHLAVAQGQLEHRISERTKPDDSSALNAKSAAASAVSLSDPREKMSSNLARAVSLGVELPPHLMPVQPARQLHADQGIAKPCVRRRSRSPPMGRSHSVNPRRTQSAASTPRLRRLASMSKTKLAKSRTRQKSPVRALHNAWK